METIEEASKKHMEEYSFFTKQTQKQKKLSFIEGAKWQVEQDILQLQAKIKEKENKILYTEEEIKELVESYLFDLSSTYKEIHFGKWFEQNKKK